jgi:pimeloyl-ACP methyl ester carboxylesterase
MGGAVALEWTLRHGDDVQGLVLIDSWAKTDPYLAAVTSHWSRLAADGALQRLTESLMLFCLSPQHLEGHPDLASALLAELITNPSGFQAQAEACVGHDVRDRLGEIAVPTLVVCGRHDILMRSLCQELADLIHGATLASVDSGHVPFWERPQETIDLVGEFLAVIHRT